jgi:hypothetical protein
MPKNVFVGVGISKNDDPFEAGKEAVEMAISNMRKQGGKNPSFAVVFCSGSKYGKNDKTIKKLVDGAHSLLKKVNWIGCTTAGEISNFGVTNGTCVAMVVGSRYIHASVGIGNFVSKNPKKAGEKAINDALSKLKIDKYVSSYIRFLAIKKKKPSDLMKTYPYSGMILLPGSTFTYPGFESDVIEGVTSVIGGHIPLIGGSAGDDFQFKQTYQFANGNVYKDAAVILLKTFDVMTAFDIQHGFEPTNKTVLVTESLGKIVKTFNNKPAIEVYSKMVGWPIEKLKEGVGVAWAGIEQPFGISDVGGRYWIKSPQVSVDTGISFFAKIPERSILTLMKANKNKSIEAPKKMAITKFKDLAATFVFDCGGRKSYLKEDVVKEIEILKKEVNNTPFIGFYTYGEIGFSAITPPNLNNGTIVAFSIRDRLIAE